MQKLLKTITVCLLFTSVSISINAQNIGINSTGAIPDSTAMLDIVSTVKGILIPRMTTAERVAIVAPAKGLLVFDNTTSSFWYFDNVVWVENNPTGTDGNGIYSGDGTTPAGTDVTVTDYINFDANTMVIDGTNNFVGIGTTTPSASLDVVGTLQYVDGTQGANKILTSDAAGNATWSGNVNITGALILNVKTVTTSYTVLPADNVVVVQAAAPFTVTLPDATTSTGRVLTFKKKGSSNNVTIDGQGVQTIDGVLTYTLNAAYKSVRMISTGSEWLILGGF